MSRTAADIERACIALGLLGVRPESGGRMVEAPRKRSKRGRPVFTEAKPLTRLHALKAQFPWLDYDRARDPEVRR